MGKGKEKKKQNKNRKHGKNGRLTAKTADKHVLYQKSVQDPPHDIRFMDRVFKKAHGRKPQSLREDFCGTALMCADWVKKGPERQAVGLDLDDGVLAWGHKHNIDPLGESASRVELLKRNVMDASGHSYDIAAAFNFSYCVFKERPDLVRYCAGVRNELNEGGAFFMDIHGGLETTAEVKEQTKHEGFTYVWDQAPFDAINGCGVRHIHFRFSDGSKMKKAFTYDWRIWDLPELRDALCDAGFSSVDVYWEGADKEGNGNGVFRKTRMAEQEQSWIAYVVAWK